MPTARAFEDLMILALDDGGDRSSILGRPRSRASATLWAQADHRDPGSVRDGG